MPLNQEPPSSNANSRAGSHAGNLERKPRVGAPHGTLSCFGCHQFRHQRVSHDASYDLRSCWLQHIRLSLLRHVIPHAVRISTYVLIVGTFVTVVDLFMQATVPAVSQALGAFAYLIVVNCMILGRHEAFSSRNSVGRSVLDAIGTSVGFLIALVLMGGVRELLGAGSLFGRPLLPDSFEPWVVMGLPPGGFFTIAFVLLGLNGWALHRRGERRGSVRRQMHPVTPAGREIS